MSLFLGAASQQAQPTESSAYPFDMLQAEYDSVGYVAMDVIDDGQTATTTIGSGDPPIEHACRRGTPPESRGGSTSTCARSRLNSTLWRRLLFWSLTPFCCWGCGWINCMPQQGPKQCTASMSLMIMVFMR